MDKREVDGVDIYNFPGDLLGHPLLAWMGDDYAQFVVGELSSRFQVQDPGTEMLAIKCEAQPQLLTSVDEQTNTVTSVLVDFNLQVLLRASTGDCWRLRGLGKFGATGLGSAAPQISVAFDILSTEKVS